MTLEPTLRRERRFPRYSCNQRLCVRYRANGLDQMIFGRCTVVGKGGLGALVMADLEIGQVTHLELSLPASPVPRMLKAQIVSRSRSNYGFQFMETDMRNIALLHALFNPAMLQIVAKQSHVLGASAAR